MDSGTEVPQVSMCDKLVYSVELTPTTIQVEETCLTRTPTLPCSSLLISFVVVVLKGYASNTTSGLAELSCDAYIYFFALSHTFLFFNCHGNIPLVF